MKAILIKKECKVINLDKVRNIRLYDEAIHLEYDNYDENRLHRDGECDDWNCEAISYATAAEAGAAFKDLTEFLDDRYRSLLEI